MSNDRTDIASPTGNSLSKLLDKNHQGKTTSAEPLASSPQGALDSPLLSEEPQGLRPSMQKANPEKAEIP